MEKCFDCGVEAVLMGTLKQCDDIRPKVERKVPRLERFFTSSRRREVILVRRAERLDILFDNLNVYQSSLRLSLRLCATRHATSYTRTVTDMLLFLWSASPKEMKLIKEHQCFTAKTEGGKNIGKDCMMETHVNAVRDHTEKVYKQGHDKRSKMHLFCV